MRISLNWLEDYINFENIKPKLSGFKLAEFLADKLTNVGFEVEEIDYMGKFLENVYVCRIDKIEKHPEADRLFVCQINLGDKIAQIVTNATNIKEGDLVSVSLAGAHLANGIDIKPTKMRGIESDGMFCSGEELGIDNSFYDGASENAVLVFKDKFKPGTPLKNALMLDDYVLDVSITANRPDCMSVVGIAREISAILKISMKNQDLIYKTTTANVKDFVNVEVKDFELCPRYMATAIRNVKINKSPLQMRARLLCAGIHPINNIVDITNYVLIECGQPMHAFDATHISGSKIIARRAKKGESISVLNGNTYELSSSNFVIADEKDPMVIAGVIGGVDSCINNQTKTCIFESACFERSSIRKTARGLGVRTDSSARFEKGVDIGSPEFGMKKALCLIEKLGAGDIVQGILDVREKNVEDKNVVVSKNSIDQILGFKVENEDIVTILENLGIKTKIVGDQIALIVPSFRWDIENEADVAEEIIRMYGYDIYNGIEKPLFENISVTEGKYNPILKLQKEFKDFLISRGFNEILSYSLVPSDSEKRLNIDNGLVIRLSNPLSEELSTMRTTMAHSLFTNIAYNIKRNNKEFKVCEAGRTYHAKSLPLVELPIEKNKFALASIASSDDFFTFKGYFENLIKNFELKYKLDYSNEKFLHPGVSADIFSTNGEKIGFFGKIHPKVAKNYEIPENTLYMELDCDKISELSHKNYVVKKVSKFPTVERDLAIVVEEEISAGNIEIIIKQCSGKNFYSCKLFDVYRNKQSLGSKKSLAFNIKFSSDEKTLVDDEINHIMEKILNRLKVLYGATLR